MNRLHALLTWLLNMERRIDPFIRPPLDFLFQAPGTALLQWLINRGRPVDNLGLAEERIDPEEERFLQSIIDVMRRHLDEDFRPGDMERGGNTKTHGLLKGEFTVHDGLPERLRHGLFAKPGTYPCYVRLAGPGPHTGPDIDDVGVLSIGVKVMGVPGEKLMEDERFTQDFTGVSTPAFVTPNTRENAKLQVWSRRHLPIFYFLNPKDPHVLDMLMQGLWSRTESNPLGAAYYSTVPYLLGEGQAMQYAFLPERRISSRIKRLPLRPSGDYLRENMAEHLAREGAAFTMALQVQTDARRMPVEHAGVIWPERLSPRIPAAVIRIPPQIFDTPERALLARRITINPWHCLPAHRPLGNQNRARKRMYYELSRHRQRVNGETHLEPTGAEP